MFTFDLCFDSLNPSSPSFASQDTVFSALGCDILDNVFKGYNACIFAYGQTGSGKSYTMMGSRDNPGIIPRLCNNLFDGISSRKCDDLDFHVQVSYMEIYNEKVHDLLDPCGGRTSLKVREHSLLGPYVDGLSVLAVSCFDDIEHVINEGNKSRTVAATNMNSESSRSHAVFTVLVTQKLTDRQSGVSGEKVSRVSLVDLAGSERATKTGAVGDRLKEGSNINRSLTTLGLVISKLAEASAAAAGSNPASGKILRGRDNFIPYRDSVLTWLLKDNLGGNSRTIMVATVSPAADNYAETLSTLRYADRAKRIVNHAVINEDPNAKIIRELRKEVEELRQQLVQLKASGDDADLRQKLDENEKIMQQMSEPWEEKLQKTERLQHERQQALEKMGISVQAVGIGVQKNNFYLVNLNADPAMNELLVYYLKERTVVGLPDNGGDGDANDIQLCGLGIRPVHCVLSVEAGSLLMEPASGARCCLNGAPVLSRVQLQHGDRLVWGNNHFFRVNCPRDTASTPTTNTASATRNIDYAFAQQELISNEVYASPLHSAIERLEQRGRGAGSVNSLARELRPMRSSFSAFSLQASSSTADLSRLITTTDQWSDEKEDSFRRSLSHLKQEIVRANALVREAASMADELLENITFSVTLQIPPCNLSANCHRATFACEPAVLVKRGVVGYGAESAGDSVWSMAIMEQRLADMREAYSEWKAGVELTALTVQPFRPERNGCHQLLGVANVFLEVLLHDVRLSYDVPVISQQAEVVGRLQVDLERVSGSFSLQPPALSDSVSSHSADSDGDELVTETVTCRVTVRQATGLSVGSSGRFVFCQYNFWGCSDTQVCAPVVTSSARDCDSQPVRFHHCRDFVIPVCEEFMEHCADGALSIEVWGHQSRDAAAPAALSAAPTTSQVCASQRAQARSLADRWAELSRQLQLSVQLMELDDEGEYRPVQVLCQRCDSPSSASSASVHSASGGNSSGGGGGGSSTSVVSSNCDDVTSDDVYQLRQGQQRRVSVQVHPVSGSGTLPLLCDTVTSISIGSVVRSDTPLDSYQEHDLTQLRSLWTAALDRRKQYLDTHLQSVINKSQRTASDAARERSLLEQWVQLSEERNAVLVPMPGSGIPGAPLPVDVRRPPGVERHMPVLFLNLNAEDLTASGQDEWLTGGIDEEVRAGHSSFLSHERGDLMIPLSLVRVVDEPELVAVAQWDSSVHDSVHLNKISSSGDRIYLLLRVCVRLSQPYPMDVTLRKRLCVSVYKPTFANKLMKTITSRRCEVAYSTSVVYQVVSNVPRASEQLEERQSLAQMAAASDSIAEHGSAYIEKYLHGVSAVESLLRMDRLRQSVLVKELLQSSVRGSSGECAAGTMRKTASVPNISLFSRGESAPAALADAGHRADLESSGVSPGMRSGSGSDGWSRHSGRMSTVHEDEAAESNDCSGSLSHQQQQQQMSSSSSCTRGAARLTNRHTTVTATATAQRIRFSRTFDSLVEIPGQPRGLASTASSGYGSQTVSSSSLLAAETAADEPDGEEDDDETVVAASTISTQHAELQSQQLHVLREEVGDGVISSSNRFDSCTDDISTDSEHSTAMNGSTLSLDATADSEFNALTNVPDDALVCDPIRDCSGNAPDADIPVSSTAACNLPVWVSVGEPVLVRPHSHAGVIRYVGAVRFASGLWIGVELHQPHGRNDGSVHQVVYFSCQPRHGVFVRVEKLIWDHRKSRHSPSVATTSRTSSAHRHEHSVTSIVRRR